jgi:hypothetical protein
MNTGGMEPELVLRSMKLLAEEILPAFADDPPLPNALVGDAMGS